MKLSPWLYTIGMFLFWEAACWLFSIPVYFLPSPTVILHAFSEFRIALWENSIQTVLAACKEFDIPCGYPANASDIEMRMQQGFSVFVMGWGESGFATVDLGRRVAGR